MAKQLMTLYIHSVYRSWDSEPKIDISNTNLGDCDNYTLLGTREVEIDIPEFDALGMMVETIEAGIKKERAESQSRVNILLDRLSKLKAIGHDSEVVN